MISVSWGRLAESYHARRRGLQIDYSVRRRMKGRERARDPTAIDRLNIFHTVSLDVN